MEMEMNETARDWAERIAVRTQTPQGRKSFPGGSTVFLSPFLFQGEMFRQLLAAPPGRAVYLQSPSEIHDSAKGPYGPSDQDGFAVQIPFAYSRRSPISSGPRIGLIQITICTDPFLCEPSPAPDFAFLNSESGIASIRSMPWIWLSQRSFHAKY